MSEKNIYQRMSEATSKLGVVAKNLEVATGRGSYRAVSERDIMDAVKPVECECGIYSYPFSREIIESDVLESVRSYKGDEVKTLSKYLRLKTVYRFVNIDKADEYIEVTSYADGIDTGDKATGKAMTYCDKYALMKAYKISTGDDDPDKDASPERGYSKAKATYDQLGLFGELYNGEEVAKILKHYKVNKADDLPSSVVQRYIDDRKESVEGLRLDTPTKPFY